MGLLYVIAMVCLAALSWGALWCAFEDSQVGVSNLMVFAVNMTMIAVVLA